MVYIIDRSALTAFLWNESGADLVRATLRDQYSSCYCHILSLSDVHSELIRELGPTRAREITEKIYYIINVRHDMDNDFCLQAASYRAEFRLTSLYNCFSIALARRLGAAIITADRQEFDMIKYRNIIPVKFIR